MLIEQSRQMACEILHRNSPLVGQFLSIAERKLSTLDDYGHENWSALDREIFRCIGKIANAEGGAVSKADSTRKHSAGVRPTLHLAKEIGAALSIEMARWPEVRVEHPRNYEGKVLYYELFYSLEERFRSYHSTQASSELSVEQLARMTGVEFENHLMRLLKQLGCSVSGTPSTGDQGADIIAQFSGRTIVIQAKRSASPVRNQAVQEVVAALGFYGGTDAWVITNSTFTEAARELASKNKVRLICGADLPHISRLLEGPKPPV